jgi:5'-nucleotidase
MRILVDMDGVLADFEGRFLDIWRQQHPDKLYIAREQRNTAYLIDQYPARYKDLIQHIFFAPGFFRSLPPIPGGLEALTDMRQANIEVFICTTPFAQFKNCVLEKFEWVEENLGPEWIERIILTFDKTLVSADYLIDDMPSITGLESPSWKHILYHCPQNASEQSKKRLTWDNWKEVMLSEEKFREAYANGPKQNPA